MRYNKLAFVALVVAFIAAAVFATNGPATAQEAVDVAPGLREAIVEGDGGMYVVVMRNQADLSAAYDMDWNTRGHFVYNTLVETARVSQADLLDYLRAQGIRGQTIYTANAVIVESGVEVFDAITARGDVLAVEYHHIFEVPELEPVTIDESVDVVEWGVDKINAPDIWAQGFFGSDIVVGSIDTGIDPDHPALVSNYRGAIRGSDDHAFFDPSNICSGAVCDNNNHGTHTIGTMVGDDGAGNQIGVAPQAEVIASKGCESTSCSTAALLASFDWMVAPCDFGDAPGSPSCDPNERPHVVNNSWGGGTGNTTWIASIEALHAAGIIPVFSAGNSGPGAGTVGSPGDYCDVIGVGATDINDMIASFSSRGPVTCVDTAPVFPNTSKPDVSAPGVNVRSSIDGGGYANFQGTSMAAPHVAGCIALLLEAGAQDYLEAWDALTTTAVDLGSTGFDNDYGFGRIDCFEAFDTLEPGITLSSDDDGMDLCLINPDTDSMTINIGTTGGYSGSASLSAVAAGNRNLPSGWFSPNPVGAPGSSTLTINGSSAPSGTYSLEITATSGPHSATHNSEIRVWNNTPGGASLVAPVDGATGVSLVPSFDWNDAPDGTRYDIGIYTNPGNPTGSLVALGQNVEDSEWTSDVVLSPNSTYYWGVRAKNPCGQTILAFGWEFETGTFAADILLVDDDDNEPDVRSFYTDALDNLGVSYDVWDTNNSDDEPTLADLSQYPAVVWFSGDEWGGFAGPGAAGETALAAYLDAGGAVFISSQDYHYDRGLTSFMQNYLGVTSATNDTFQTTLNMLSYNGALDYTTPAMSNFSDVVTGPNVIAVGDDGDAGTIEGCGMFLGTPWEATGTGGDEALMGDIVAWLLGGCSP